MYSIGKFSEKTGVSIRTLHYYDEIGLLEPKKHPTSGHRLYTHQDLLTLQKILSLKFLGYELNDIAALLHESSFTMDLNETLLLHLQALEREKEQIEQSITAIKRVIALLKEEGEVDSAVLFSLLHSIHTEKVQKEWMQKHMPPEIIKKLEVKSEEERISLDRTFIQLAKQVKQLYGRPAEDPKVQEMIQTYLQASFAYLGEDLIEKLAEMNVEELDIQEWEEMTPVPFTEDEQQWLYKAIGYHMNKPE